MKNILFVLPFRPYPLESGGHQAIYNGIRCISGDIKSYVTYVEYGDPQNDNRVRELENALGGSVECFPYYLPYPTPREKVLNTIYRLKYRIKKFLFKASAVKKDDYAEWMSQILPKEDGFLRHVNELIRKHSIDVVQCEMLETAHVVLALPENIKTVFVEHEIGFVRKQLKLNEKGDCSLAGTVQVEINKVLEVALLNKFNSVVTLSEIDRNKLISAGVTSDIYTSFAIVNTPINKEVTSSESSILSFVGPEWHPSNKAGLLWFLENCWHALNTICPYSLRIIGNWSKETIDLIEQKYRGVYFMGFVDNLGEAVKNTIMIVPITIGSGIRMKILEACAIGVPVVSTTVGAEGLPLTSGKDCFIADTPEAFFSSIIALSDESLRLSFINSSQALIENQYSLSALRNNRLALYATLPD